MKDAEILALEQINEEGGLRGRKVEWVIADGRSDPAVFAQEARRLIETEKVCVIFGCWNSPCRKRVSEVVERAGHLLVFSSNYEGMDSTSNVVCTGPIPNQQVIPGVNWCFETLKARRFFLAGCTRGYRVAGFQRDYQRPAQGPGGFVRGRKTCSPGRNRE